MCLANGLSAKLSVIPQTDKKLRNLDRSSPCALRHHLSAHDRVTQRFRTPVPKVKHSPSVCPKPVLERDVTTVSPKNLTPARAARQSPGQSPVERHLPGSRGELRAVVGPQLRGCRDGTGGARCRRCQCQPLARPTALTHALASRPRNARTLETKLLAPGCFHLPDSHRAVWAVNSPWPLPVKPFRLGKLIFSSSISYASLFGSLFNMFGRTLLLTRAPAIPITQTSPKPQPKSLHALLRAPDSARSVAASSLPAVQQRSGL